MRSILFILLAFVVGKGFGQEIPLLRSSEELPPIMVNIEELAWIAGEWKGENAELDAGVEEYWYPPMGNAMMGCFRMMSKGELVFYEFMQIRSTTKLTELQIKHFSKDLVGWEAADETESFALLRSEPGLACFDGLTFKLVSENRLVIWVVMGRDEEGEQVGEFVYVRQ